MCFVDESSKSISPIGGLTTFLQTEDCEEVVMETVLRKRESLLIGHTARRTSRRPIRGDSQRYGVGTGNNREEFGQIIR